MRSCLDIFDSAELKFIPLDERQFPDDYLGHIINGDCVTVMESLPKNSIDLIITSPPYFVNKSYENTWTFEQYHQLMGCLFKKCHEVLKPGRYFVINFGDYFNKDRFYQAEIPSVYPASLNFFQWGRDARFDLQATRIWRKQFSRMAIPFVCNHHPRPVFDYEHIWTFRKPAGHGEEFVNDRKLSQRAVLGEGWSQSADLGNHEAAFPIDLPLWAIDVYSQDRDEIVLDPFFGMGTTAAACIARERKWIGIEIDPEVCRLAQQRIQEPLTFPKHRSKKQGRMTQPIEIEKKMEKGQESA